MRACLLTLLLALWALPAQAHVQRFALIVGNDRGASDQEPLRYALRDADRIHDVLRELGGFEPSDTVLLRNESADVMRRSLIALNDRIRSARELPDTQVMLLVYYSGHGDGEGLRMSGSLLGLSELGQLVRGSAADFRILILDACRSGSITQTRAKGFHMVAPFALPDEQEQLPGSGLAYLTASSADEDAQESDQLEGSFFTHALVNALLGAGDSNGDAAVSLDEAYRYAYESTLRATSQTLLGMQHPSFRYDLSGQGALILSRLHERSSERTLLSFPGDVPFLVLRDDAEGAVVAEVRPGAPRTLSLPAGRYFVRAHGAGVVYEGELRALPGTSLAVSLEQLQRIEGARLVRLPGKGASAPALAHKLELAGLVRTPLEVASQPCFGGSVGYGLELAQLSVYARLGACTSETRPAPPGLTQRFAAYSGELRAYRVWDFLRLSLALGLGGGVSIATQRFEPESDRIALPRTAAVPFLAIVARAEWDLGAHWFVALDVAAETHFVQVQRERSDSSTRRVNFVLTTALGLGLRF